MPRNNFLPKDLENKRVGLVLCGGGFKGAYQIGVWRALSKLGIKKFHTIAGTSVGALNAVLIANNDFKTAKQVWKESTVMTFSPRQFRLYLAGYSLLLGPIVLAILLVCIGLIVSSEHRPLFMAISLGLAMMSFCSSIFVRFRSINRLVFLWVSPTGLFVVAVLLVTILGAVVHTYEGQYGFLGMVGLIVGIPCGWIGLRLLERGQRGAQLLSSEGLLDELRTNVDLQAIKANVKHLFVTTARGCSFQDPFHPNPILVDKPGGDSTYELADWPGFTNGWTPTYHDLCQLDDKEQAIELLRLSSALPIVLPGAMAANSEMLVDGGLADNMPLLPVLSSGVDFVIIVCLDPLDGKKYQSVNQLDDYLFQTFLKQWIPSLSSERSKELYLKWLRYPTQFRGNAEIDLRTLVPEGPRMHGLQGFVLAPDNPLPIWNLWGIRFITGTLNWRRDVRRKWMILGFRETRRTFRSGTIGHFNVGEQ